MKWLWMGLLATTCSVMGWAEKAESFNQEFTDALAQMSNQQAPPIMKKSERIKSLFEAKLGYFFFSDAKMRKVYNAGGWDVQLCGTTTLKNFLQIYGSLEYLERHGKSLQDHQKTSIWEIPLSLGLQPVVKISSAVHYYATLGPRYFFVQTHNRSSYIDKHMNANGLGGFFNTGFHFLPWQGALLIDVFGEYSYARLHFHPHKKNVSGSTVQVGGFCFGFGLGHAF